MRNYAPPSCSVQVKADDPPESETLMMTKLSQECSFDIGKPAVLTQSAFLPAAESDPLLCNMALSLCSTFYPLGFAVEIVTNSPDVLDAATESWGHLHRRHDAPVLQLRIGVVEDTSTDCPPPPLVRAQRHLLSIVADAHNQAICDLKAGFAFAWLNHGAVQHRGYLRYHFIESTALVLISTSYATPIHAACVSRYGRGMLFCGDSGVGKSSLAYACARAGWIYTSDDASYVLRSSDRPCVIGHSHQVRFRPSARELFPELRGRSLTPRPCGKPSIEVPTSELSGMVTANEAAVDYIIFLNRQPSATAELLPLSNEVALQYFRQNVYPLDEIKQPQIVALEHLSRMGVYELRYSDLHQAVDRLERLAQYSGTPAL